MNDESMTALEAELLRQNVALIEFNRVLQSLGDVELQVPASFLEELDEIAQRCEPTRSETINGLRA